MRVRAIPFLEGEEDREILKAHCRKNGIKIGLVEDLVREELDKIGLQRRDGIFERMDELIRNSIDFAEDGD